MTEKLREQLSALVDDELEHAEVELLLRRYADNEELRVCWSAYHVIGETLRDGHASSDACQIAGRVAAALESESESGAPFSNAPVGRHQKGWRPFGAVAAAAAVGVVAVLVVRTQIPGNEVAPVKAATVRTVARQSVEPQAVRRAMPTQRRTVSNVHWNQTSPRVRRQLNRYLIDHNETVPALSRQGMLPYVHMAAFYAGVQRATVGNDLANQRATAAHDRPQRR